MRRIVCAMALVAIAAVIGPASGDTQANGCSTTAAATVSPLLGQTAPVCTFNLTCTGATLGCTYLVSFDVNGTGSTSGTMSVGIVSPAGTASFAHANGSGPAPNPSCSGLFQCHDGTTTANDVLLFVTGAANTGSAVRVTCAGGGISALETVSCNLAAVEFGP